MVNAKIYPCKRNSDNTLGLYNTVTNEFLTNQGTGTLTAGSTTLSPSPDNPMDIVCNNGAIKYSANMANVNAQTALIGYYISSTGVVTADVANWIYQDYIPVEPSTTYTLTISIPVYYVTISEYSTADDRGFIRRNAGSTGGNTKLTITTRSNTKYIRFGTNIGQQEITLQDVLAINWMLNRDSTALPYTPYVEGGIYTDGTVETVEVDTTGDTATAENLLGVRNKSGQDIYAQDVQNVTTGAVTRNVGVKAFDGTETWTKSTNTDADGNNVFYSVIADRKTSDTNIGMSCTHYVFKGTVSYSTLKAGEMLNYTYNIEIPANLPYEGNEESMRIAKLLEQYNIEVSLNVSPVQILQAGFVNELVELAKQYEVDPNNIALEITETFLMENFDAVNAKLKLLQGYGFKIHLDDFCTGYSSMLYLKELPINSIKIDKEFTRFLNTDSYSRAIVNKLAALANSLELEIIVEGVEDEKQLAFLTKNGCNIIQGFLVSKAVPFNSLVELIEGVNVTKKIEIITDKKKK